MSKKIPTDFQHLFDAAGQILPEKVDDLIIEVESGKLLFDSPIRDEVVCLSCRRRQPYTKRCNKCGAFQIRQATQTYSIQSPDSDTQMRGRIVYAQAFRRLQDRGVQNRNALRQIGFESGILDRGKHEEKSNAITHLERIRSARDITNDPQQKLEFDAEMDKLRIRVIELSAEEAELFSYSAEHLAERERSGFYVAHCTRQGMLLEDLVWDSYEAYRRETNQDLVFAAHSALMRVQNGLPVVVVRALSRSFEWRQRWKTAKASGAPAFSKAISDWNPNQIAISYWSDFYDSIYEHPDRPEETTIQDDELLQSWINDQLQKQKQAKAQRQMGGAGRGTVTQRTSDGRQRVMVSLGNTKTDVKSPFKIRTQ